jgi:cbb3-type cytochrome oxidase subunit 1
VALYVAVLSVGGIVQGLGLNDAAKPFADVMAGTVPYLKLRTVAVLLIALGQAGFAANLAWLFCRVAAPFRQPIVEFVTGNPASAAGK